MRCTPRKISLHQSFMGRLTWQRDGSYLLLSDLIILTMALEVRRCGAGAPRIDSPEGR
ncbi:MAG: hypothetical protein RIS36_1026 [Pseudomonadota bacterium]|jgi:hypothetical protein